MDDFTAAVSLVVGSFAFLFGWRKYRSSGRPRSSLAVPTADVPAVHKAGAAAAIGDEDMLRVREACRIHERWSVATNTHVACFDLFAILGADEASFCGDADSFAAAVGPSMQDQSPSGDEKTRVMMRAWDYLSDAERYASYTTVLTPLIAEQRQALGLDCAAHPPGWAQPPGPGGMSEVCGW